MVEKFIERLYDINLIQFMFVIRVISLLQEDS